MKRPNGYKAEVYGGYQPLPAGGYVCVIKGVKEDATRNGTPVIKIQIDIAEGEFRGYYSDRYNDEKSRQQSAKWKGVLTVWPYDRDGVSSSRSLNALGGALDDVGVDIWLQSGDLNIHGMIGRPIGVVFRREEFRYSDGSGKTGWTTKPVYTKPASDIRAGNFSIPDDKPLGRESTDPAFSATDDDIPF